MVLVMLMATALRPGQETPRCFFTSLLEKELRSMSANERDEVESLLNRIFEMFEFSRYTGPVIFTKLFVRLRNEYDERDKERKERNKDRDAKSHDHSLVVFCVSYESPARL
jgi:hypothetical protein